MPSPPKLFFLTSFIVMFLASGAQLTAEQRQVTVLRRMIEKHHIQPRPLNDSFSSDLYSRIIGELHRPNFIFLQSEVDKLSSYRLKLDEELGGSAWEFLPLLTSIHRQAVKRADSIVKSIASKPINFSVDEKATLKQGDSPKYAASVQEMRQLWEKWLKLRMLEKFYDQYAASNYSGTFRDLVLKNEPSVREKISSLTLKELNARIESRESASHLFENYLTAIAETYDPHTRFFSPKEKEGFESLLNTDGKSFGFMVSDDGGKVVVGHLVPGGPAWKSGEVHRNDQVLAFHPEGKEEIDVTMISADEFSELLESADFNVAMVRLKKTDGALRSVYLKKELVKMEENVVKGFVLKGSKNIGYISLPDFYTMWDDQSGSSCADDVSKEIVNLKKEKIEGLILDIRFNGGGSMYEALQLMGIFINEGPLIGQHMKGGKPVFIKDPNRGTIFDGPMVVLINGQSASASEVFASGMQDYNRAVVVGSTSFGKATMQQIFPMDTVTSMMNVKSPNGYVKITTGKLYRLNGRTAQKNGVTPDIQIPDLFETLEMSERSFKNSIAADSISANTYYRPLGALPLASLSASSRQRIQNDAEFAKISSFISTFRQKSSQARTIPLKMELFEQWKKNSEKEMNLPDDTNEPTKVFTVANHKYESDKLKGNSYAADINASIIKNLVTDSYIAEAYRIILDLAAATNK